MRFGELLVKVVEPGTVVGEVVVDDEHCAVKNDEIYVTVETADAMMKGHVRWEIN